MGIRPLHGRPPAPRLRLYAASLHRVLAQPGQVLPAKAAKVLLRVLPAEAGGQDNNRSLRFRLNLPETNRINDDAKTPARWVGVFL